MENMIKHHIIVKWNETVLDKKSLLPQIKEIFDKTLNIEGVKQVELIENVINRPNRYDLMIRITMLEESLESYDKSAPHKEWKEKYSSLILSKTIFDSRE